MTCHVKNRTIKSTTCRLTAAPMCAILIKDKISMQFAAPIVIATYFLAAQSTGWWVSQDPAVSYPDSQIGNTRSLMVGKLDCSARLLDLQKIQTYCFKGTVLVDNHVSALDTKSAITVNYFDTHVGEQDADITWLFAFPDGFPKTVKYQVAWWTGTNQNARMLQGQF